MALWPCLGPRSRMKTMRCGPAMPRSRCKRPCAPTPRRCAAPTALPCSIRVGLNSGEVVVRTIGNDLHMDYSAVGQTTHLAARMEQLATPGSDPPHGRDAATGRGLGAGQCPGAGARQGPGRTRGGLRADGRESAPHGACKLPRPVASPALWGGSTELSPPAGPGTGTDGSRSGGGAGGRGRCGKVPPDV